MPIFLSEETTELVKFLKEHNVAVLATATKDGIPHAATIYYTIDDQMNVYFMTKEETAKTQNIRSNPVASVAVHETLSQTTAQIYGRVEEITDQNQLQDMFSSLLYAATDSDEASVPPISHLAAGKYVGFKLIPDTARLAVYNRPNHDRFDRIFDIAPQGTEPSE